MTHSKYDIIIPVTGLNTGGFVLYDFYIKAIRDADSAGVSDGEAAQRSKEC